MVSMYHEIVGVRKKDHRGNLTLFLLVTLI